MTPPYKETESHSQKLEFEKLLVRIRLYRTGLSITQSELATKLGLSLRTYQRVEQGLAPLEVEVLYKLAEVFEIPYKELAGPNYKKSDIEGVQFFKSLADVKEMSEDHKKDLTTLINSFYHAIEDEGIKVSELFRRPHFKNHPRPYYYSDAKWVWANKTTIKNYDPTQKGRVSVTRNLTDYKFIIKIWEVCYEEPKQFFVCDAEYDIPEVGLKTVRTLNYFDLLEGFPFQIGTVLTDPLI